MVDEIDRRLIAMLERDGRRRNTTMAAELEISEATVRSRIAKLTETGILSIVALCNPLTLGHQSIRFLISIRDHSPRSVARALIAMPMINHVALATGAQDIYLEATCRDLDQLVSLLDDVRRVPGVANIDQFILTKLYKDYSWTGLAGRAGQASTPSKQ